MEVKRISTPPLYTKQQVISEGKAAATSALLSGGLTLALNKGHGIKRAGKVAGFAAGISLLIGLVQRLYNHHKEVKSLKAQYLEHEKTGELEK